MGFQHHYSGAIDAFQQVWREGGFWGLYRGWYANLPKTFTGSATQLTVFGLVTDWLRTLEVSLGKYNKSFFIYYFLIFLTFYSLIFFFFIYIIQVLPKSTFVVNFHWVSVQWLLLSCCNATF